jgi:hypothetical protein
MNDTSAANELNTEIHESIVDRIATAIEGTHAG